MHIVNAFPFSFLSPHQKYLVSNFHLNLCYERFKVTREKNTRFLGKKFYPSLRDKKEQLRKDVVKHPELKEYRKGGSHCESH